MLDWFFKPRYRIRKYNDSYSGEQYIVEYRMDFFCFWTASMHTNKLELAQAHMKELYKRIENLNEQDNAETIWSGRP